MKAISAPFTAALVLCCLAGGSAAAATNIVGGHITLAYAFAYGPPAEVIERDSFDRRSSLSSVTSGVNSVVGNDNYIQIGRMAGRAGYGSVGMSASTSYQRKLPYVTYPGPYESVQASGTATAIFTDVLVTGPGSGNISTRLRMHLGGVLATTSVPSTNTDGSVGNSFLYFGIYVNNNLVGWGNRARSSNNGGAPEISSAGALEGFGESGVVTTSFFSIPLNTPVILQLELSVAATSRLDGTQTGVSSASSHYYNSLSFAADQPVFDLPSGYTATSTDGNLVNNRYVPNTNAPVLNIHSLSNVVLSWPATNQTTQLEYSTNISGPWSAVPTAPILTNSQFVLSWTNRIDHAFFRLQAQ